TAAWRQPVAAEQAVVGGSGRAYLESRRRAVAAAELRTARAREIAVLVEEAAGVEADAARHRFCPSPDVALSSALLVRRDDVAELTSRLRRLAPRLGDV